MKKTNKKGFTIVELVIVIAVIAILAAALIPTFSSVIAKAKESNAQQTAAAKYKEIFALDMSDGTCDGQDHGVSLATTGVTITNPSDDGYESFAYNDGTYTSTLTGGAWKTEKNPANP